MATSKKLTTDGGAPLAHNPFGALAGGGGDATVRATVTPSLTAPATPPPSEPEERNRGRVDVLRSTAGRGGKTVTVVQGFVGIGLPEKEQLAKAMQKRCGSGGTVKEGRIEIQGDQREAVVAVLRAAGFRPVLAGG
jgi:translation initiation factor 1